MCPQVNIANREEKFWFDDCRWWPREEKINNHGCRGKHTNIPDNDYWGICLFHVVWTNFFAINLILYTRNIYEIQWDRYIVWLSFASRRLYNILYFLWLYNEFFIILSNILKIAELDCCQIIILSIYVPSTHAYTHVLRLSLDLPYETR
jgi:hypothetical protein